jgi:SAM-dependent methyltransferase
MDPEDKSNGYEACAETFIRARNPRIGVDVVREWVRLLPKGATVIDLGCGHGVPISQVLINQGSSVFGIDASPTLISEFRRRFPDCQSECAAIEDSRFFSRLFDGAVAWGLIFLLKPEKQRLLIEKVARALHPGGLFLFTSPEEPAVWQDSLTGCRSVSLGAKGYLDILGENDFRVMGEAADEGENHYYFAAKNDL